MTPTALQNQQLLYRDTNNYTIRYVSAPLQPLNVSIHTNANYDSDYEPLIATTPTSEPDSDALLHFTATGRPIPAVERNLLHGMSSDMYSLPHLLPKRYTDESIIPAIIVDYVPKLVGSLDTAGDEGHPAVGGEAGKEGKGRRKSLIRKLTGRDEAPKKEKGLLKVVYMPRGEYLKHFARGFKGEYVGSEPFRRWPEEELEERYARFKPVLPVKRGYRARF